MDDNAGSWRRALAPGEQHGFWENPGWWDARELAREDDDVPRLRAALIRSFPPLPASSRVLDVGAGTGTLIMQFAQFYPHLDYALLDGSADALARAKEKLTAAAPAVRANFIVETVDPHLEEPLTGGPYALITSTIALHDIAPPAAPDDAAGRARHRRQHVALLRRIAAALVPGGHFIYADAMRPGHRVVEHLALLQEAGFVDVDCAYAVGRMLVCGGRRTRESDIDRGLDGELPISGS